MADPSLPPIPSDGPPPGPSVKRAPPPGPKPAAGKPAASSGPAKPREKYITAKEFRYRVREAYGHLPAQSTVHRWLREAKIPAVRIGHLWLIPERAWVSFLASTENGESF